MIHSVLDQGQSMAQIRGRENYQITGIHATISLQFLGCFVALTKLAYGLC